MLMISGVGFSGLVIISGMGITSSTSIVSVVLSGDGMYFSGYIFEIFGASIRDTLEEKCLFELNSASISPKLLGKTSTLKLIFGVTLFTLKSATITGPNSSLGSFTPHK